MSTTLTIIKPKHMRASKRSALAWDNRSGARCTGFNQFRLVCEDGWCPKHHPIAYSLMVSRHRKDPS